MRKWRNDTFLSLGGVLKNKQNTSVSRLMSFSLVGTAVIGIQGSAEGVIACSDGENRRGSLSGRTLRGSSLECGTTQAGELDREELF